MPSNGRVYAGGDPNFNEATGKSRRPGGPGNGFVPTPRQPGAPAKNSPITAPKKNKPGAVGRVTPAPSKGNAKPGQQQGVNKKGLPPVKSGPYRGPGLRGR